MTAAPCSPEINSFSEKPPAVGDVSAATSDIVAEESGEEGPEKEGGKLSLRMRLVTPMEEGSSERFSLQSKGPRWGRVRGPAGEGGGEPVKKHC